MKYENFGNSKYGDLNVYVCEKDIAIMPGTKYGPVIRDFYVIDCCTEGNAVTIINGVEYHFNKGDCMVLFPGDTMTHITGGDTPRYGIWCAISGIKISSYLTSLGIDSKNPYLPAQACEKTVEILYELEKMMHENDAGADLRRSAYLHRLFGEIMRYAKTETDSSIYIRKAINIIEAHYSQPITVAYLATCVGLERSYFSTLFSKHTGISPQGYITNTRIKRACTLLSMDKYSISETATAVGIPPDGFSRVFKSKMGVTPGQYRKNIKKPACDADDIFICCN